MIVTLFWCAYTARGTPEYLPITRSWFAAELSMSGQYGGCKQRGQPAMVSLKTLFMPRLAICSRDLHWHWINRTLLCDTMEVSMLSRAWLTIAQHVFQPALTGRPELISRKIVSGEPGTKAIAVSRFREKLSPANWVQGVIAISRKISRSWAPKKWGPTCDRDISNSAIYTTAIYRAYTVITQRKLFKTNRYYTMRSELNHLSLNGKDFNLSNIRSGSGLLPDVIFMKTSRNWHQWSCHWFRKWRGAD